MIAQGIVVTEKQVLFRIDSKLLESLDRKIAREGFTTRNAWFKQVVGSYAGRGAGAARGAAKAPARGAARGGGAKARGRGPPAGKARRGAGGR